MPLWGAGAAALGAAAATPEDARQLRAVLSWQWEQPYEHQMIPRTLLDFIAAHIRYDALRSIYEVLARNLSIGRSIPRLVSRDKNPLNRAIYRQCLEAADRLVRGDVEGFAGAMALFPQVQDLVASECKRLGYWDAAMEVYDGAALWR